MGLTASTPAHAHNIKELLDSLPKIETKHVGDSETTEYRVHCLDKLKEGEISMWHDIKLFPTADAKALNVVNMINEVDVNELVSFCCTTSILMVSLCFDILDPSML
jgi:hypothetical protein